MEPTVVYVHGNGNKIRGDLLRRRWDEALFGRDMATSTRMAYWAPLRYERPIDELEAAAPSYESSAPPLGPETAEEFIAETVREAEPVGAPTDGVELEGHVDSTGVLEAWLQGMTYAAEALVEGEDAAQSSLPSSSTDYEVLPLPRAARTAAFRALVKVTFTDVHAYFFGGYRDRMRQVVRDTVAGIDGPVVVIAHSLGSIIAYDVLREPAQAGLDIPLFVTVGSPLAVTEVEDLVERPLAVPAGATAWRNASDARDVVALDHTIRPEYAPPDRCTDVMVVNDSANHHGIREYLQASAVRGPVLELVGA